jgi:uncharacterized membrane protein
VTDIIVVALLRVNGFTIKESLCKALFNLLTRAEFRGQMIGKAKTCHAYLDTLKVLMYHPNIIHFKLITPANFP